MGFEKVGISAGKGIIAWVRTGKSLLATRPVKINTQRLRYIPALKKDVVQLSSYLLSEYKINSKTMKTLYSSEFKLPKELNKDGFYSTSVIDKKTGIPVKVYVKRTGQQIPAQTGDYEGEQWEIFTKNKNGEYESLGTRIFEIDRKNKKIGAGWMDSDGNNGRYSGIGIRLHQISIERMIQENFANIEILTKPEAFPFHYKCGFRASRVDFSLPTYFG